MQYPAQTPLNWTAACGYLSLPTLIAIKFLYPYKAPSQNYIWNSSYLHSRFYMTSKVVALKFYSHMNYTHPCLLTKRSRHDSDSVMGFFSSGGSMIFLVLFPCCVLSCLRRRSLYSAGKGSLLHYMVRRPKLERMDWLVSFKWQCRFNQDKMEFWILKP